jgi:hypothetical protein
MTTTNETTSIINDIEETVHIKKSAAPKIVFIVPYRDREHHLKFFSVYMKHVMSDYDPSMYEIYIVHQTDGRPFNRGGMKNIGFLAVKEKYPNEYQDITFVFNDVDTVPCDKGVIQYETRAGIVKHFYGVKFALGGIFSIKGGDFERTNGFPNFWAWGGEDNYMQHRVLQSGLKIDRRGFFPLQHPSILQMVEGIMRTISRSEAEMVFYKTTNDGLHTIQNLSYKEEQSSRSANTVDFQYIHVSHFDCAYSHASNTYEEQNIHEEKRIKFKSRGITVAAQEEQQRALHQQQVLAEQEERRIRIQRQQQQQQQQRLQQQQQQQRLQQQQQQQRLQQQQQPQPQQRLQQQPQPQQPQPQQRLQQQQQQPQPQRVVRRVRGGFF